MTLRHHHQLRLQQKLSPQLILNLRLLTLGTQELERAIQKEIQHNPALQQIEDTTEPETTTTTTNPDEETNTSELLLQDEEDMPVTTGNRQEQDTVILENITNPVVTYRETLLPKLLTNLEPSDTKVAEEIVEWLDEDGLLSVAAEELAASLGVELAQVQRVLTVLKRIPPGGIGCRDVQEALLVQLDLRGFSADSLEVRIVKEGWELFRCCDTAKMAKLLDKTQDEVLSAIVNIGCLEPKPGRQFNATVPEYVVPDFAVEWRDGRLEIQELDVRIPRLSVARRFIEIVQNPQRYPRDTVAFAREKVQNAVMFLRAIESRRRLLRRLVELLLERQKDFFIRGPGYLKPLTVKEAGLELRVSASTVSRAISGKFIETTLGIFKLKDFFRVGSSGVSRTSIKERVREMIEREDKSKPLSDEQICYSLGKEGVRICRRTVAKYRAELGIPGSEVRRRG